MENTERDDRTALAELGLGLKLGPIDPRQLEYMLLLLIEMQSFSGLE
jgi:hypothetical protein